MQVCQSACLLGYEFKLSISVVVIFAILASELRTLPGRVGQSEAAPLEVDAAVHQQPPEQQRGVSR